MEERILVHGGRKLRGSVAIGGMKNAALPILFASVLTEETTLLRNLPKVSDVAVTLEILRKMGAEIECSEDFSTVRIDPKEVSFSMCPPELTRVLRGSSYLLGAGLGREGFSKIGIPGGCDFGNRPLDLHFRGLRALGAEIRESDGEILATTKKRLSGTNVKLDFASVGATANLLLASCRAKGTTVIENAAKEPHIVDLVRFLRCMGARIQGEGTSCITVSGVDALHGCDYRILPDMIEAGTYLIAGAGCGGEVTVENVIPKHLEALTSILETMGAEITRSFSSVTVRSDKRLFATSVKTEPYPGFATDLHPQLASLFSVANGIGSIREEVWGNRFRYLSELRKMGASVENAGRTALFFGSPLHGATVNATDLRAGAALILAGLFANGITVVTNPSPIFRGYPDPISRFTSLGAEIYF